LKMKDKLMSSGVRARWVFVAFVVVMSCSLVSASTGRTVAGNTPSYVSTARNVSPADPSTMIEVSLWLNPHNRAGLDALAAQLYDRTSPNYRHWLTSKDIAARFAPTAAEAETVQEFLKSHNLKIVKVGSNNFYVRARGTIGDMEKAFRVQLNNYEVLGKTMRANDRNPYVDGAAGDLVMAILGFDNGQYEHPVATRSAAIANGGSKIGSAATPPAQTDIFSNICFDGPVTETFSTLDNGSLPIATVKGNHLNMAGYTSSGCGYTPPMIQHAFNLTGLYAEGYTGGGQTIGIIDWCGSFTIQNDANAFSRRYSLPPLVLGDNFTITSTGQSYCEAFDQVEINLDVEWAHAIAPGANINLIVPPTPYFQDIDQAEYETVNLGLANVISGSFGSMESWTPVSVLENENLINELAAVTGISANFASGDQGDFTYPYGIPATVIAPADSPWATAVGGTTLALNSDDSIAWQAGWGNNQTLLAQDTAIYDPPDVLGFVGGSGGGPSNCATQDSSGNCLAGYPKPSYQNKLPGKVRLLPDVSWLADPYTGAAVLIGLPYQQPDQVWEIVGGTSLATPMFSALWAIANQEAEAGGAPPLGLASEYLYSMPAGTIFDIVPVGSKTNVTGSVQETNNTTKNYTANQVLGPVDPPQFVTAIWDYIDIQNTALAVSFGTDCDAAGTHNNRRSTFCTSPSALRTKVGWDNVTGVGTPNARAFADFFFGK